MIKVKEAVAEARNAAKDFFNNAPLLDLQLEGWNMMKPRIHG